MPTTTLAPFVAVDIECDEGFIHLGTATHIKSGRQPRMGSMYIPQSEIVTTVTDTRALYSLYSGLKCKARFTVSDDELKGRLVRGFTMYADVCAEPARSDAPDAPITVRLMVSGPVRYEEALP